MRKRRDSSSSSSSDSGTSDSKNEEVKERVKERKDPQQSQLKTTLIAKVDTMNNHLFMIQDVLHHMMGEMKRQTAMLLLFIEYFTCFLAHVCISVLLFRS